MFVYKCSWQTCALLASNVNNRAWISDGKLLFGLALRTICLPYPVCHKVLYLHILLPIMFFSFVYLSERSFSDVLQDFVLLHFEAFLFLYFASNHCKRSLCTDRMRRKRNKKLFTALTHIEQLNVNINLRQRNLPTTQRALLKLIEDRRSKSMQIIELV